MSYASQDAEATRRICEGLRAAGIEVWFDQSELRGGDAWDASIRKQIKTCALFIPVISRNTHAREEGYFRLEWKLAIDRSHLMTTHKAFLLPIVIDDTLGEDEQVPERFRELHWTRLPGGETPRAFVQRVSQLILPGAHVAPTLAHAALPAKAPWRTWAALLLVAAAAVIAGGYYTVDKFVMSKRVTVTASGAAAQPIAPTQSTILEKSIAVLPFVDMSEKKDQEYFSDGLSEELIERLARSQDLRVIARTSSFQFKGKNEDVRTIAGTLGVANLIEGSVRKSDHTMRVTVQLIRAADGTHIWSQTYDRDLKDVFKVQDEITGTVVQALKVAMSAAVVPFSHYEPNLEAYDLVLEGKYFADKLSNQDMKKAIGLYKQAIDRDSKYALAWAELGIAYFQQAVFSLTPGKLDIGLAIRADEQALRIDPNLIRAHGNLAMVHMIFDWDWSAAKSEIDVMKAIDPNDVTTLPNVAAVYAGLFGRFNESIAVYRGMLKRDPLAAVIIHNLAVFLSDAGEFEESVATSRRLLQMHRDYSGESASLGLTLLQLGQKKEALEAIQGESNENARLGALPIIYWAMGRRKDANETLATFKEKYANTDAASVADAYAFRGEIDAAFEWLDRAHRQHEAHMAIVKVDPLLKNLHRDPRYQALLVKMKLDGDGSSPRH